MGQFLPLTNSTTSPEMIPIRPGIKMQGPTVKRLLIESAGTRLTTTPLQMVARRMDHVMGDPRHNATIRQANYYSDEEGRCCSDNKKS